MYFILHIFESVDSKNIAAHVVSTAKHIRTTFVFDFKQYTALLTHEYKIDFFIQIIYNRFLKINFFFFNLLSNS